MRLIRQTHAGAEAGLEKLRTYRKGGESTENGKAEEPAVARPAAHFPSTAAQPPPPKPDLDSPVYTLGGPMRAAVDLPVTVARQCASNTGVAVRDSVARREDRPLPAG